MTDTKALREVVAPDLPWHVEHGAAVTVDGVVAALAPQDAAVIVAAMNALPGLLGEVEALRQRVALLEGAGRAQDERERAAGAACGVPYDDAGCDWPEQVADEVLALRAEITHIRDTAGAALKSSNDQRDAAIAEANALRAQVESQRPLVEAARRYGAAWDTNRESEAHGALLAALRMP